MDLVRHRQVTLCPIVHRLIDQRPGSIEQTVIDTPGIDAN